MEGGREGEREMQREIIKKRMYLKLTCIVSMT